MTEKSTKCLQEMRFLIVLGFAVVAMLVFAGPAAAHGQRHHHGPHHRHRLRLDSQTGGPAGTIASFDQATGKLTINLAEGETITGLVTEDTIIELGQSGDQQSGSFADNDADDQGESSDDQGDFSGSNGDWSGHHLCDFGGGDQSQAMTEDLKPGATVEDAVLVLVGGKATFVKIDLAASEQGTVAPMSQSTTPTGR